MSMIIWYNVPQLIVNAHQGHENRAEHPRHPGASPGCLLVFPCRGDAKRRPARGCSAIQVLHSRLRRSFRMTVCCAAILRGAAFMPCGGACAGARVLPQSKAAAEGGCAPRVLKIQTT